MSSGVHYRLWTDLDKITSWWSVKIRVDFSKPYVKLQPFPPAHPNLVVLDHDGGQILVAVVFFADEGSQLGRALGEEIADHPPVADAWNGQDFALAVEEIVSCRRVTEQAQHAVVDVLLAAAAAANRTFLFP